MNAQMEELYLDAEADVKNGNFAEAFRKYQQILYEEPANGPTHNSLGWLYKTQVEDFKKAEAHYLASMKGDPLYPHAWFNYATLLTDMERYDELESHLENCLTIPTIEKSWVYLKLGIMEELKLHFPEAIRYYEKAVLITLNDDKVKEYQQNIDRCRSKIELSKNHTGWFGKFKLK